MESTATEPAAPGQADLVAPARSKEERTSGSASLSTARPPVERNPDQGARLFVWGIWALALAAAVALTLKYQSPVFWGDDWYVAMDRVCWQQPITLEWLWSQYAEYRYPLFKIILVGLHRHYDFRVGMFLSVFSMGLLAAGLIWSVRRIRGWTSYADAFFPLALLHCGNWEMFWAGPLGLVATLPTLFLGFLFLLIVRRGTPLGVGGALLFTGYLLIMLLIGGGISIPYVPALSLCLGYSGWLTWRSGEPRGRLRGAVVLGLGIACMLLVPLYFIGYKTPEFAPTTRTLDKFLQASTMFLSMSVSRIAADVMPFSAIAIILLITACTALLARAWYRRPEERFRAFGIFMVLGGVLSLAVAAGTSRTVIYAVPQQFRYTLLAGPLLWCVYFAVELYGRPTVRRLVQMSLLSLQVLLYVTNLQEGIAARNERYEALDKFDRDLRAGVPHFILVERYALDVLDIPAVKELLVEQRSTFSNGLIGLHRTGIKQYKLMREDPSCSESPLSPEPTATSRVAGPADGGFYYGQGENSSLTFELMKPQFVYAIRFKYTYANPKGAPVAFRVCWKDSEESDFSEPERCERIDLEKRYCYPPTKEGEWEVTVWVNHKIDRFRIHPDDKPFGFRVSKITLLVPKE